MPTSRAAEGSPQVLPVQRKGGDPLHIEHPVLVTLHEALQQQLTNEAYRAHPQQDQQHYQRSQQHDAEVPRIASLVLTRKHTDH